LRGAAGAAGDLADELEGAFCGAEVGDGHGEVGVEDADELDVGEVEAFGDHLGADEEVEVSVAEVIEGLLVVGGVVHGVGVHALEADGGEFPEEFVFGALGSLAEMGEAGLAERAGGGELHGGEAVVALDGGGEGARGGVLRTEG